MLHLRLKIPAGSATCRNRYRLCCRWQILLLDVFLLCSNYVSVWTWLNIICISRLKLAFDVSFIISIEFWRIFKTCLRIKVIGIMDILLSKSRRHFNCIIWITIHTNRIICVIPFKLLISHLNCLVLSTKCYVLDICTPMCTILWIPPIRIMLRPRYPFPRFSSLCIS